MLRTRHFGNPNTMTFPNTCKLLMAELTGSPLKRKSLEGINYTDDMKRVCKTAKPTFRRQIKAQNILNNAY